jgi:excisionase family DNA binding protein
MVAPVRLCRTQGRLLHVASHNPSSVTDTFRPNRAILKLKGAVVSETTDAPTADEAVAYLRVGVETLYRLVAMGGVPSQQVNRLWRFRRSNLVSFLRVRPR